MGVAAVYDICALNVAAPRPAAPDLHKPRPVCRVTLNRFVMGRPRRDARTRASAHAVVTQRDVTVLESARRAQAQMQALGHATEQTLTRAQYDWIYHELQCVDQVELRELTYQVRAAEHDDRWPGLSLERAHRAAEIGVDEARIVPIGTSEGTRHDEFAPAVHALGEPGHGLSRHRCWPPTGHLLVRDPAEEELTVTARVALHPAVPLRIMLVCPAHVALCVADVTIERDLIEYREFAHKRAFQYLGLSLLLAGCAPLGSVSSSTARKSPSSIFFQPGPITSLASRNPESPSKPRCTTVNRVL